MEQSINENINICKKNEQCSHKEISIIDQLSANEIKFNELVKKYFETLSPERKDEFLAEQAKLSNKLIENFEKLNQMALKLMPEKSERILEIRNSIAHELYTPERIKLILQHTSDYFLEFIKTIKENVLPDTQEEYKEDALLYPIKPHSHTMPNNALMNCLQDKSPINAGAFDMVVSNETKRRKEITTYTIIDFNSDDVGLTFKNNSLTEYERQVSDAIISLWEQAKKENIQPIFTADMIYRSMPGGGDKASPQQRGAITRTIEKFRCLRIEIDATEEMIKREKIKAGEQFTINNYYLVATEAKYKTKNGGQSVTAYRIDSEPIILQYAKMTNQILTIQSKCITIKKIKNNKISNELISMNANRQAITGYILRQIAWMKYDRRIRNINPRSSTILFDTLFEKTDTATNSRTVANRNRDFVYSILDYEIAIGYIIGYEKITTGNKIMGVKIQF